MPKLIILNGACGVGKNTIAQMYADDHPGTEILDVDEIRRTIPNYRENRVESGKESFRMAYKQASNKLANGHDVIIPSCVRWQDSFEAFEQAAKNVGAEFVELLLDLPKEAAIKRAVNRGFKPGGLLTPDNLAPMYEEMMGAVEQRPHTIKIDASGDVDSTYQTVKSQLKTL